MTWDENIARYVARKEGFVPVPYGDGANLAYAFGHNGTDVKPGMKITLAEGFELLKKDLDEHAAMVDRWLTVPVSQDVFNMLVSASFNAGSMLKAVAYFINNGQMEIAFDLLGKMIYVGGKENAGLKTRRQQEVAIGRNGDYGDLRTFPEYDDIPRRFNFKRTPFPKEAFH